MKKSIVAMIVVVALTAFLTACSSGSSEKSSPTGMVTVTFSDPPTCNAPTTGVYKSIFVTIADVQIHTSATAGNNDPGWVDLTPNLKSAPKQIDLLAPPPLGCFLATLGTAGIPPGTYQQIRLVLTDSTAGLTSNACATGQANCVALTSDALLNPPPSPRPLLLSSQDKTGIKIPPGQIAGGKFTIGDGESKDLNINLDGCASVVVVAQGNGQFRLKPVLNAGEVSLTASAAITGHLQDDSGNAITNASNVIVVLEQKDANGIERMVAQTTPDANGNFSFCPMAIGASYELVAAAITTAGNVAFGPTLVQAVKTGTSVGNVQLTKTVGTAQPVTLGGTVANDGGNAIDFTLSALQQATLSSGSVLVTVPLAVQQNTTMNVMTTTTTNCPLSTTNCWAYSMMLPAANIAVGTIGATGISYTSATSNPNYKVEAHATSPSSHADTCSTPVQSTPTADVTPGGSVTMGTNGALLFLGSCAP